MKNYLFLSFLFILFSCQKEKINSNPDNTLSKKQQEDFKLSIVRYFEKLPKKDATHETKFDTTHNSYYVKKAKSSDLLHLYIDADSTYYFAVAKIAPSLKVKKVATIGKLKKDKSGAIISYEEAVRTWKMEEQELKEKTNLLFEKYVNQEDLSPYYTANSDGEFYIEFPDQNTFYNTETRRWETK
ncbi:hypothetical protein [Flavobacterium sp.]|jgi:hypothetical protein|uniref:hypothetical protein n=1 Tax=Flavobacterium sp. TaxID=239 RepID=UPI0037C01CE3